MAESTTAPTNKYVAFKDRAQKEYGRRGLISETAMKNAGEKVAKKKKKHSEFAKRAGHNPPVPEFAASEVRDRYGNTYTLDPGYTPSRTSPLPAYRPPARTAGAPRDIRTDAEKKRAAAKTKTDTKKTDTKKAADTVPLPRPRPESTFATRPYGAGEPTFATRAPPVTHPFDTPGGIGAARWTGYAPSAPADTAYAAPSPAVAAPSPASYAPAIANPPLPPPRPDLAPSTQPTFAAPPPRPPSGYGEYTQPTPSMSDLLGIFRAILPSLSGNPRGYYGG